MIERYTITASASAIQERFRVDIPNVYTPRYNASPTQLLPVILQGSVGVSFFYWGTPPQWAKNKHVSEKLLNARAENFTDRLVPKKALKKNRCLIPADGFYVWRRVGKKTLIPYRFTHIHVPLFSIAGVWEEFENNEGDMVHTFKMLTVPSSTKISAVCERIPLLLNKLTETLWVNDMATEQDLLNVLHEPPIEELTYYTVSPDVYTGTRDVASLILPAPSANQFGNLTLFD